MPAGVLFDLLRDPALNSAGQVAFVADLRGTGITTANNTGLWAQNSNGSLSLVAREGDTLDVDDGPGVDLRTVTQLAFFSDSGGEDGQRTGLNQTGELAFTAAFSDSSTGVFVVDLDEDTPGRLQPQWRGRRCRLRRVAQESGRHLHTKRFPHLVRPTSAKPPARGRGPRIEKREYYGA